MIPLWRVQIDLVLQYLFIGLISTMHLVSFFAERQQDMKWIVLSLVFISALSTLEYWSSYSYATMRNWCFVHLSLLLLLFFSFPNWTAYLVLGLFHVQIFRIFRAIKHRPRSFWDLI